MDKVDEMVVIIQLEDIKKSEEDEDEANIKTEEIKLEDIKEVPNVETLWRGSLDIKYFNRRYNQWYRAYFSWDEDFELDCDIELGEYEVPEVDEEEFFDETEPMESNATNTASCDEQESNVPHGQGTEELLNTKIKEKRESRKIVKVSCQNAREENSTKLGEIPDKESNPAYHRKLAGKKFESLLESISSSFDNSDGDVVPAKLLKQEQKEKERYKTRYINLEKKYFALLEINCQMQKNVLRYFKNFNQMNSNSTVNTNEAHVNTNNVPAGPTSSEDVSTHHRCTTESSSLADTDDGFFSSSPHHNNDHHNTQFVAKLDDFKLAKENLIAARIHIKSGQAGDSQYTKNLASAIWPPKILVNRSISGKKGNYKGKEAKKKLTPQKLQYIKDMFKERCREENPLISTSEIEGRSKSINTYIAQKIATLNRVASPAVPKEDE